MTKEATFPCLAQSFSTSEATKRGKQEDVIEIHHVLLRAEFEVVIKTGTAVDRSLGVLQVTCNYKSFGIIFGIRKDRCVGIL